MKKIDVQSMSDVWFSISVAACATIRLSQVDDNAVIAEIAETLKTISEDLDKMEYSAEYYEQVSKEAVENTIKNFIKKEELLDSYQSNKNAVLKDLAEMLENCKDVFFERLEVDQIAGKSEEEDLTQDFNDMIDCQQELQRISQ